MSINKQPYFVGETFSDQNADRDPKQEALISSDTNALAVTSDQTKIKRKISKQVSTANKNAPVSSSKTGKNKSETITASDVAQNLFEPNGKAAVSPIH